jgi:hypothetical protein
MTKQAGNPELEKLGTHQAGAVQLHQTRTSSQAQSIGEPVSGPGGVDPRSGKPGK